MQPEQKLRRISVLLVIAAALSILVALIFPLPVHRFTSTLPTTLLVIPLIFSSLAVVSLFAWSLFYLPETLRYIVSARRLIFSLGILATGGPVFLTISSLTLSGEAATDDAKGELGITFAPNSGIYEDWVLPSIILIVSAAACFLTWLYFTVARDERDNGTLHRDY